MANAETEDQAWSTAYTWLRATEHPHAQLLMERLAWAYPDRDRWKFLKNWNAEEGAKRLATKYRAPCCPVVASAKDTAAVRAMDGLVAYLRVAVEGGNPSPRLLDDMRNLGLRWPWRMDRNLWGDSLSLPGIEELK